MLGRALLLLPLLAGPATAAESYLVAPFENASPVRQLDWMASSLATTVAEKLEAHPQLRPAYGPAILEGWGAKLDPAVAAQKARAVGARWLFTGAFARPNWKAEVRIRLYEVLPSGAAPALRQVASATVVGDPKALLELLDEALGKVLADQGWTVEGERLAAIKRRPTRDLYALTLYGRGLNQFHGLLVPQDLDDAQKTLQKAVRIDPKFAEAHRALGLVYLARGERSKAIGALSWALDLRPTYYAALVSLAALYRHDGRRQPALDLAKRALDLRPGDLTVRFLVGQLAWESGDGERALAELSKVVAEDPRHLGAQRLLAQVHAARGEIDKLVAALQQVVAVAPDDLEARLDLGSGYMRLGKDELAVATYEELLARQPKNVNALKFSGDLYRRLGQLERAIAAYERMRHLAPEDPRPYFLLAACYVAVGNESRAEQVLLAALDLHRHVGEAWIDLGALAMRRGDLTTANWYLSRAVERAPTRPKAHYNWALLLHLFNQRDKALAELRLVAELDPDDPECHYLSGVIHLREGRLDDAKQAFLQALKRRPAHVDALHNLTLLEDLDKRYNTERAGTGAK